MSAMDQNPVGLPETLRAADRFVPSPVISVIPAVRKTPELVRSTFGEFELAPAMRSVTTLKTRTSYGVWAMTVPCSNS